MCIYIMTLGTNYIFLLRLLNEPVSHHEWGDNIMRLYMAVCVFNPIHICVTLGTADTLFHYRATSQIYHRYPELIE